MDQGNFLHGWANSCTTSKGYPDVLLNSGKGDISSWALGSVGDINQVLVKTLEQPTGPDANPKV